MWSYLRQQFFLSQATLQSFSSSFEDSSSLSPKERKERKERTGTEQRPADSDTRKQCAAVAVTATATVVVCENASSCVCESLCVGVRGRVCVLDEEKAMCNMLMKAQVGIDMVQFRDLLQFSRKRLIARREREQRSQGDGGRKKERKKESLAARGGFKDQIDICDMSIDRVKRILTEMDQLNL